MQIEFEVDGGTAPYAWNEDDQYEPKHNRGNASLYPKDRPLFFHSIREDE
jgi:hypothetical protein